MTVSIGLLRAVGDWWSVGDVRWAAGGGQRPVRGDWWSLVGGRRSVGGGR
ncbi:hypothetical protein ACFQ7A_19075 [Streptomyces sp. NPDC056528]